EKHLENYHTNKSYEFAVTDRFTGKLYGTIGLTNNYHFNNGEIAYWIGEEFWGNGFATEAAQAIMDFAFKEKKYHKLYARYFHSNPASGRVLEKLGMKQEGILIDHVKKDNQYESLIYQGIINQNE